jgi:HPP family
VARNTCRRIGLRNTAVGAVAGSRAGIAIGAAVGLAILAMVVAGAFHPPAGIDPLLVVSNNLPWSFLFAPMLAGAVCLCLAPMDPSPAVAAALVVARVAKSPSKCLYDGLASSLRLCSANCSPSRVNTTLRWWNASSVLR